MPRLIAKTLTWMLALAGVSCSNGKPNTSGTESITGENSGDEIRLLFSDARSDAVSITRAFSHSQVSGIDPSAIDFLKAHKYELADEIAAMPHEWSDRPAQAGCASTSSGRGDPLYFSFSQCKNEILSKDLAVKLLIHEAVHHFGYESSPSDEAFADQVALADYAAAQERQTGLEGSVWQEGSDWFPAHWIFQGGVLTRISYGADEQHHSSQQIDKGAFTFDGTTLKWTPDYTSCPRLGILPGHAYQVTLSSDHLVLQLSDDATPIHLIRLSTAPQSSLPVTCSDGGVLLDL